MKKEGCISPEDEQLMYDLRIGALKDGLLIKKEIQKHKEAIAQHMIDIACLQANQKLAMHNAKISTLAEKFGVSATAIRKRMRGLSEARIKKIFCEVD